jgi:hypothetical protein
VQLLGERVGRKRLLRRGDRLGVDALGLVAGDKGGERVEVASFPDLPLAVGPGLELRGVGERKAVEERAAVEARRCRKLGEAAGAQGVRDEGDTGGDVGGHDIVT